MRHDYMFYPPSTELIDNRRWRDEQKQRDLKQDGRDAELKQSVALQRNSLEINRSILETLQAIIRAMQ